MAILMDENGLNTTVAHRLDALDWAGVVQSLQVYGFARLPPLLTPAECQYLTALYDQPEAFRSKVVMQRYSFGEGEYQYFNYPLPELVQQLREGLYQRLVGIANDWQQKLTRSMHFPPTLAPYLQRCHQNGQCRPTPLLLRYGVNDYNCLHQDLYGDFQFPLQTLFVLNQQGRDFTGGENVLVEQRPKKQSRPQVVSLNQGEGMIFAVSARPVPSARGHSKVIMRHGVSQVHWGLRHCLGIIFHDAS